jgi:hypothetical protein
MDITLLVTRIVHVGFGVFWAGTIFFMVFLLEPSVRSVGPDGGRVMGALQQRGFLTIMPVVALLTILSGAFLYWQVFAGVGMEWITTPFGTALTIGGIASLLAFGQGFFLMRPASLKIGVLVASMGSVSDDPERETVLAEIAGLKARSRTHARWVALWLGIAVLTMAIARYL